MYDCFLVIKAVITLAFSFYVSTPHEDILQVDLCFVMFVSGAGGWGVPEREEHVRQNHPEEQVTLDWGKNMSHSITAKY